MPHITHPPVASNWYNTRYWCLTSSRPTPIQVAIRYDQLFRQAAARDPLLCWDTFKEDLLVWCSTRRSFRAPISSRLGPPTHRPNSGLSTPATTNTNGPSRRTHTEGGAEICKRYNLGNCTRGRSASSLMPAGMQAVELCTQPRHAPCGLPLVNELQRAHSPLRCSGFERELRNYPDKAFVTWLLDAIDNGVSIGYSGPRTPHTSHNSKIELCRHTLALF